MSVGVAQIKGYVEDVSRSQVRGWALDTAEPSRRLQVQLLCDGRVISTAVAEIVRGDLAGLGAGRTDFGFAIPVVQGQIIDLRRISVRVAGQEQLIPMSPDAGVLEGVVEGIRGSVLSGWAWRGGWVSERVQLEIRYRGNRIGQILADAERRDLLQAGIGDGKHGFELSLSSLPAHISDDADGIEIAFAATGQRLHDLRSPAQVLPGTEHEPEVSVNTREIASPQPTFLSAELLEALRGAISFDEEEPRMG